MDQAVGMAVEGCDLATLRVVRRDDGRSTCPPTASASFGSMNVPQLARHFSRRWETTACVKPSFLATSPGRSPAASSGV